MLATFVNPNNCGSIRELRILISIFVEMTVERKVDTEVTVCPLCGWKTYFRTEKCPHCGGMINGIGDSLTEVKCETEPVAEKKVAPIRGTEELLYGVTKEELEWYRTIIATGKRKRGWLVLDEADSSKHFEIRRSIMLTMQDHVKLLYNIDSMTDVDLVRKYIDMVIDQPYHALVSDGDYSQKADYEVLEFICHDRLGYNNFKRLLNQEIPGYLENKLRCKFSNISEEKFLDILFEHRGDTPRKALDKEIFSSLMEQYIKRFGIDRSQFIMEFISYKFQKRYDRPADCKSKLKDNVQQSEVEEIPNITIDYPMIVRLFYSILRRLGLVKNAYGVTDKELDWYKSIHKKYEWSAVYKNLERKEYLRFVVIGEKIRKTLYASIEKKYGINKMSDIELIDKDIEIEIEEPQDEGHEDYTEQTDKEIVHGIVLYRYKGRLDEFFKLRDERLLNYIEKKFNCNLETLERDLFLDLIMMCYEVRSNVGSLGTMIEMRLEDKFTKRFKMSRTKILEEICKRGLGYNTYEELPEMTDEEFDKFLEELDSD